ncbi:MAG: hypothetical protein R3304_00270, partial [Longimicrobiales bacterium]|nr:hypothetical protein [Longimicrobiales bacterium]
MAEAEEAGPGTVVVWEEGRRVLLGDPVFGPWVRQIGSVQIPASDTDPFAYLTRAICSQQLAGAAAATIHGRVVEALGGRVTPDAVLETRPEPLRDAGLSRSKLKAIRDLASRLSSGDLALDDLAHQPDEEV